MRRRRIVCSIFVLACICGYVAWKWAHSHDPRLVGQWIASQEPESDWTEGWEIRSDGTGMREWRRLKTRHRTTVSIVNESFLWWTDGERVSIRFGASATGWERVKEIVRNAANGIGRRSEAYPAYVYTYAVEDGSGIRITPYDLVVQVDYDAIVLTPAPERPTP